MNGRLAILLTMLVVVPTASGSQDLVAVPVARVLKVKGTVRIRGQDGKPRLAEVYGVVREDEQLLADDGDEITLGFRCDGHMERLTGPCQATVTKEEVVAPGKVEKMEPPPKHRQLVAVTVKRLKPLSREGTRLLKGPDGTTSIGLTPIHMSTILSPQPKLSWPPVANADGYEVVLFQADRERIWTSDTTETSLDITNEQHLHSGHAYAWEVTAKMKDQNPLKAFRGEFTVATEQQRSEAGQFEELAAESRIEYLVLASAWYEVNGLVAEAIAASRRVVELDPESASAFWKLATLYDQAGRRQDAEDARKRATSIESKQQAPRARSIFDQ